MADLLATILDLEVLDADLFRGRSPQTERQRVFGGQVAGQAVVAAGRTVGQDRRLHSLHAYFLRPGDPHRPIIYAVDRIRDGGSFTTRRVVATQRGEAIFHLSASFHIQESGLDHALPMPDAPDPEALPPSHPDHAGHDPIALDIAAHSAIDLRYATARPLQPGGRPMHQQVWFRVTDPLPEDPLMHVCAVAYASDLTLLVSSLLPHGRRPAELQMASLDHAMWFHRTFRADAWLLYDMLSPSAHGARGMAMGSIYTHAGDLAVSVVQEGLMRPITRLAG